MLQTRKRGRKKEEEMNGNYKKQTEWEDVLHVLTAI